MRNSTIAAVIACLALSACGGGDGADTGTVSGIDARGGSIAVKSQGPVTGFGSIIVNGVTYDTSSASFEIDGAVGIQDDLAVGDVVTVSGEISEDGTTGTATTVVFDDVVEGPVDSVDALNQSLIVLGQTVQVSPDTSFDDNISPASLEGVTAGMIVEVSGHRRADGSISATRIEAKPAGGEFEVTGTVSSLSGMAFDIGALTIDFSGAQLDDFPAGSIENGQNVEAKGTSFGAGGEFIATRVGFKGDVLGAVDGDYVEIEGFITRFGSAQDFDVSGLPVITNGATIFEGGSAADLGLNIKVEVEGTTNSSGVLVAEKVDIRRSNQVRVTALVDSVNSGAATLSVLGITVNTDEATRLEDQSDADIRPFALSDLNAGDYVEVRGDEFPAGSGEITASILERDDIDTKTILQGFVESISDPNYSILGVTVETSGATVFRDANDNVISSIEFFNQLSTGDLVKAEGTEVSDTTISASEVEFENEF